MEFDDAVPRTTGGEQNIASTLSALLYNTLTQIHIVFHYSGEGEPLWAVVFTRAWRKEDSYAPSNGTTRSIRVTSIVPQPHCRYQGEAQNRGTLS